MNKSLPRQSFRFHFSWWKLLTQYPRENWLEIYEAIFDFKLNGNLPTNLSPMAQEAFNKLLPDLSKQ
jgi:hypothetical protein